MISDTTLLYNFFFFLFDANNPRTFNDLLMRKLHHLWLNYKQASSRCCNVLELALYLSQLHSLHAVLPRYMAGPLNRHGQCSQGRVPT
jgi:hypothetical protein